VSRWRGLSKCLATARWDLFNLNYGSSARRQDHSNLCTTMSREAAGYHNRQLTILMKIYSLFCSLDSSTYDEVAPKVEYWIEWALTEHSTTVDELVERVASVAWSPDKSHEGVARFLKEFRDAPHRSNRARSFVEKLCTHVLRWFAVASAESLTTESSGWVQRVRQGHKL